MLRLERQDGTTKRTKIDGKPSQKGIKKHLVKTMSEDTRSPEDGPGISDAAPARWTPYPFNSGQPWQDTDHIFEIPSLLFGGKPPSFPATYTDLHVSLRDAHHWFVIAFRQILLDWKIAAGGAKVKCTYLNEIRAYRCYCNTNPKCYP